MKRNIQFGVLAVMVVLVTARPVQAWTWWDLLEELSGPGPFGSRGNLMLTVKCSDSPVFRIADDAKSTATCLFLDQRFFKSDESDRFSEVTVSITEIGPSVRLAPSVEIGAGVGWIHFSSKEVSTTRMTVSFPRLVFMPLLALPKWQTDKSNDLGFFKIYFRETIIGGELTQKDFAAKTGTVFSAKNERAMSMGFIIDAVAAAHLVNRALSR